MASISIELAEGQYGILLSELMLDSAEGKVGRKSNPPSCWSLISSFGCWDVCPGSFAASREPGQPGIVGLQPPLSSLSSLLIPYQRHGETQVLSECGAVVKDWDGSRVVWMCIYPSFLSVLFLAGKQGSLFGKAQLMPALLASLPEFCVEFHFEEPRKESGTIRCKNPHYQWEQLSKEFSCDYELRCCFWLLESASRHESCPVWTPLREGGFVFHQDEGVKAKHQSSGMWAWNPDNPLQRENVRYICSGLSWEMELERKIRQLCERIEKWNPAELGSVPKLEWCDAFFDKWCRVVRMKNEEIWVVSAVVSDTIFFFILLHSFTCT